MHNRRRNPQGLSPTEIEAKARKIKTFTSLTSVLLSRRKSKDYSDETFQLMSNLLLSNPDMYDTWNYRRDIIQSKLIQLSLLENSEEKISSPDADKIRDQELEITAKCIIKNPKSYCAWYHRCWILKKFKVKYEEEFSLCSDFLKLDQRNFHCWNYRRFVASISNTEPKNEYQFSEEKIYENFSNYSAFHHRSIYISKLTDIDFKEILQRELNIIQNAIFTEPDDQSSWWYLRFILSWLKFSVSKGNGDIDIIMTTLNNQLDVSKQLLELEPHCKWAMINIVDLVDEMSNYITVDDTLIEERKRYLSLLCEIDKSHLKRYEYLMNKSL